MKKIFIKEIKAGDVVDDLFVLVDKHLAQKRDGNNFNLVNYTKIICDHLESSPGDRGHGRIS